MRNRQDFLAYFQEHKQRGHFSWQEQVPARTSIDRPEETISVEDVPQPQQITPFPNRSPLLAPIISTRTRERIQDASSPIIRFLEKRRDSIPRYPIGVLLVIFVFLLTCPSFLTYQLT